MSDADLADVLRISASTLKKARAGMPLMFSSYSPARSVSPLTVDELLGFAKQFARPPIVKHFAIGREAAKELIEKQGPPDEIWVSDDFWEQLTSLPNTESPHPLCSPGTPVRRCPFLLDPYILRWRAR